MEITNTQQPTTASAASSTAQANSVLSSDFETFLKMLTAQARFQDPLEPIDSSEYAAQLAQFSMVEQQVLSNDLLQELSAQFSSNNIGQMASWIGMEAKTTAAVEFDGMPIDILPRPDPSAEENFLVVTDTSGTEVQRQQIGSGIEPIKWDGTSPAGSSVPNGVYSFSVESRTAGQITQTTPAENYGRITEARLSGGETVLVLKGGSLVSPGDITALRTPDAVDAPL